jgi:hypothetical protein
MHDHHGATAVEVAQGKQELRQYPHHRRLLLPPPSCLVLNVWAALAAHHCCQLVFISLVTAAFGTITVVTPTTNSFSFSTPPPHQLAQIASTVQVVQKETHSLTRIDALILYDKTLAHGMDLGVALIQAIA